MKRLTQFIFGEYSSSEEEEDDDFEMAMYVILNNEIRLLRVGS
jgi:hypothetical protein